MQQPGPAQILSASSTLPHVPLNQNQPAELGVPGADKGGQQSTGGQQGANAQAAAPPPQPMHPQPPPAAAPPPQQYAGRQSSPRELAKYPADEAFQLMAREAGKRGAALKDQNSESAGAWLNVAAMMEARAKSARQVVAKTFKFNSDDVRTGMQILACIFGQTAEPQYLQLLGFIDGRAVPLSEAGEGITTYRHARACALWAQLAALVNRDMMPLEDLSETALVDGRLLLEDAAGRPIECISVETAERRQLVMDTGRQVRSALVAETATICQAMEKAIAAEVEPAGEPRPGAAPDNPMGAAARRMYQPGG